MVKINFLKEIDIWLSLIQGPEQFKNKLYMILTRNVHFAVKLLPNSFELVLSKASPNEQRSDHVPRGVYWSFNGENSQLGSIISTKGPMTR